MADGYETAAGGLTVTITTIDTLKTVSRENFGCAMLFRVSAANNFFLETFSIFITLAVRLLKLLT